MKAYWNNMPLTNAEGVTVLDDVDFAYVTNVEVIKGPAATMYGGGVGGAVRFIPVLTLQKEHPSQKMQCSGHLKHSSQEHN